MDSRGRSMRSKTQHEGGEKRARLPSRKPGDQASRVDGTYQSRMGRRTGCAGRASPGRRARSDGMTGRRVLSRTLDTRTDADASCVVFRLHVVSVCSVAWLLGRRGHGDKASDVSEGHSIPSQPLVLGPWPLGTGWHADHGQPAGWAGSGECRRPQSEILGG